MTRWAMKEVFKENIFKEKLNEMDRKKTLKNLTASFDLIEIVLYYCLTIM